MYSFWIVNPFLCFIRDCDTIIAHFFRFVKPFLKNK
nr:MAG TPA: hypothetical protein [Caudoviricetes sp.]